VRAVNGGRWARNLAAAAFGAENLAAYSPAANASGPLANTRAAGLLGRRGARPAAPGDPVALGDARRQRVGLRRHGAAADRHRDVRARPVTQASLDDFYAPEVKLVSPIPG
jgi:hypothetical protein